MIFNTIDYCNELIVNIQVQSSTKMFFMFGKKWNTSGKMLTKLDFKKIGKLIYGKPILLFLNLPHNLQTFYNSWVIDIKFFSQLKCWLSGIIIQKSLKVITSKFLWSIVCLSSKFTLQAIHEPYWFQLRIHQSSSLFLVVSCLTWKGVTCNLACVSCLLSFFHIFSQHWINEHWRQNTQNCFSAVY